MEMIVQALVSGLAMGSIYALIAIGFSITWNTTKSLNFGQGEFLMVGALVGLSCYLTFHLPFVISVLAAVGVVGLLGWLLERLAIRPIRHLVSFGWVMSTIGVGIILKNAAMLVWGTNQITFPSPFGDQVVRVFGAGIYPQEIFVIAISMAVLTALDLFQRKTIIGKALLATACNREWASLMGIDVNKMIVLSFMVSSGLAALGGVIVAPITTAWVLMGSNLGLKAFCAAVLGGVESSRGCIAGGVLLGVTEFLIASWRPDLRDFSVFALLIVILALKPRGLFAAPKVEKV